MQGYRMTNAFIRYLVLILVFFFKKAFLGNPKLRKPRRVFRLPISDFRLATSNFRLLTSDFRPDSSVRLNCRSICYAGINVQGQGSVEATKHKANQATDEVRLGNRNHGLAWSQSGNSDNKTVQTLLSLLKSYNQVRKYAPQSKDSHSL